MLLLIGLGLYDEKDISLRGLEEAKKCDVLFFERYTNIWFGKKENLERMIGKRIIEVKRVDLENESEKIIQLAKNKRVCILIPGDPLVSTSHFSLIEEAKKNGIKTKVIHSSSILNAILESGIRITQIGRFITIPFLKRTNNKLPYSVYSAIKECKKRNLKTVCFLDIDIEKNEFLSVNEALKLLLEMENEFKENVISKNDEIVILSKIGSEDQKIEKTTIENGLKTEYCLPATLII